LLREAEENLKWQPVRRGSFRLVSWSSLLLLHVINYHVTGPFYSCFVVANGFAYGLHSLSHWCAMRFWMHRSQLFLKTQYLHIDTGLVSCIPSTRFIRWKPGILSCASSILTLLHHFWSMLYALSPTYPRAVKTVNHSSRGMSKKMNVTSIAATINP